MIARTCIGTDNEAERDVSTQLEVDASEGRFWHGDDKAGDELIRVLDEYDDGRFGLRAMVNRLQRLAKASPDHIDTLAHLGSFLHEDRKLEEAGRCYERGFGIGLAALPDDFNGELPWGWLDNRPFLRAAAGAAFGRIESGKRTEGIELMERILRWNPNDNQGIRFRIGSEYLRDDQPDKARWIFEKYVGEHPPYLYELGILHLQTEQWSLAATALRNGFVRNPYIAELLGNSFQPIPLPVLHSFGEDAETAVEYYLTYGRLWHETAEAVEFCRWLHNHPKVLLERASVMEPGYDLEFETDFERRCEIIERKNAAHGAIAEDGSEQLVQERTDSRGQRRRPWQHWRQ